jgi:hypothetical protein
MGYNNSASTTTLTAKFTPIGRQKLILTNNNLITYFSLGDSDANYNASLPLTTGQVPSNGGLIGPNSTITNSVGPDVNIKSALFVDNVGNIKKAVEPQSSGVTIEFVANGQSIIPAASLTQNVVNINDINTDSLVNLFYTFNLPLDYNTFYRFTGTTSSQGGFSDTALSGIAQSEIVVIGIDNSLYGELIDGKSLKLEITTSLPATYTIYGTYQNTGLSLANQDALYSDKSPNTRFMGDNIVFLFSDDIQKPNNDSTLSWATGYGTNKPFSLNRKKLYNLVSNPNLNENVDKAVGVAFLDKGFIVLTEPIIVEWFDTTATTVTLNSVSTSVLQNVTCIANRGEFGNSTNPTFKSTDTPRISEVGLYDIDGDLIAIAKLDRQLVKNINEFIALGVKINI